MPWVLRYSRDMWFKAHPGHLQTKLLFLQHVLETESSNITCTVRFIASNNDVAPAPYRVLHGEVST